MTPTRSQRPTPLRTVRVPRGFTIVELMVVVGIIVLLVGLLIVALNAAGEAGRVASTRSLMRSMTQGVERFNEEHGYYPPISDPAIDPLPFTPPGNVPDLTEPDFRYRVQTNDWFSITDPVRYLVGGEEGVRVAGYANSDRAFGPYVEIRDPDLIGVLQGDVPGPDGYFAVIPASEAGTGYDASRRVILDYWGRPIRYYRHQHPLGSPGEVYRTNTLPDGALRNPSLGDVANLRPFEIPADGAVTDGVPDVNGDTTVTPSLRTARYGFLSFGPDRLYTRLQRVDEDGLNADNIVEIGP